MKEGATGWKTMHANGMGDKRCHDIFIIKDAAFENENAISLSGCI